jgi:hypothetical protein
MVHGSGDRLSELLWAWRRDIWSVPLPPLLTEVDDWTGRVRMPPDGIRTRPRDQLA